MEKTKRVSFATEEQKIHKFPFDPDEKLERKQHLQGISYELKKIARQSPTNLFCIQNLGTWMSHHQIYDFDDLELKKGELNDDEYRVMWLCLNSRINPKSITQRDNDFLQTFAKKIHDERKKLAKERVIQANLELLKDLEKLENLIAENEKRKKEEREREHYNNTVWLGLEPMDLSDDMVEDLYDIEDEIEEERRNEDNEDNEDNTKRIKFGGGNQTQNPKKTTIVDAAFFTLLFGLYMIGF